MAAKDFNWHPSIPCHSIPPTSVPSHPISFQSILLCVPSQPLDAVTISSRRFLPEEDEKPLTKQAPSGDDKQDFSPLKAALNELSHSALMPLHQLLHAYLYGSFHSSPGRRQILSLSPISVFTMPIILLSPRGELVISHPVKLGHTHRQGRAV